MPAPDLGWNDFAALDRKAKDDWVFRATTGQLREVLLAELVDGLEDDKVCELVGVITDLYRRGHSGVGSWSRHTCEMKLSRLWEEANEDECNPDA